MILAFDGEALIASPMNTDLLHKLLIFHNRVWDVSYIFMLHNRVKNALQSADVDRVRVVVRTMG